MEFNAQRGELARDDFGGAVLLEAELRVRVQIAPHRGELGVLRAEEFDGAHE